MSDDKNEEESDLDFDIMKIVPRTELKNAIKHFLTIVGLPEVSRKPVSLPFNNFRYAQPSEDFKLEQFQDCFKGDFSSIQRIDIVRQYNFTEDEEEEMDDDDEEYQAQQDDLSLKYPQLLLIDVFNMKIIKEGATFENLESFLIDGPARIRRVPFHRYHLKYPDKKDIDEFKDQMDSLKVDLIYQKTKAIHSVNGTRKESELIFNDALDKLGIFPPYLLRMEELPEYFTFTPLSVVTEKIDLTKLQEVYSLHHTICEGRSFLKLGNYIFDTTFCGWYINRSKFSRGA